MAPRSSRPTTWNEFLPISMPITATALLRFWDMACSFVFEAPCQIRPLAGQEHGRTIPLADKSQEIIKRISRANQTPGKVFRSAFWHPVNERFDPNVVREMQICLMQIACFFYVSPESSSV